MQKSFLKDFSHRFVDNNYILSIGPLNEKRLLGVNHICLHEDCVIFNDLILPYSSKEILEKSTFVMDEIFNEIVPIIQKKENRDRKIIICGEESVKRIFGRKLEDRLKREIKYE